MLSNVGCALGYGIAAPATTHAIRSGNVRMGLLDAVNGVFGDKKQDFLEQKEVVYLCYFGYQDPLLRDQMLADPFLTACLLQLQGVVLLPVVLLK